MDKRDKFEKKIKAKLEEVPMPDLDQAWENFAPNLSTPTPPIWKHWSMPYLFATTLFLISLWWHRQEKAGLLSEKSENLSTLSASDTLFIRDTVYVVDTVYVMKRVVINQEIWNELAASSPDFEVPKEPIEIISTSTPSSTLSKEKKNQTYQDSDKGSGQGSIEGTFNPPSTGSSLVEKNSSYSTNQSSHVQKNASDSVQSLAQESRQVRRSMAAPAVGPKEKIEFRMEKELVVGDTSNLSSPPIPAKSKPMVQIEGVASLLFPISRLVEYYNPIQSGFQIGLEWDSGWGIYAGAIRSQMEGELDDEEIMQLSPTIISRLPNVPSPISSLDEIYVKSKQWYFPLELRWRSLYYSGFSFESSVGLMANYLQRQDFTYEFENDFVEEYQFGTIQNRQFGINHLRVGFGTNYLFSKRVGIFLRSHYWLPLSRQGLIHDRMHGLELGTGVTLLLGK